LIRVDDHTAAGGLEMNPAYSLVGPDLKEGPAINFVPSNTIFLVHIFGDSCLSHAVLNSAPYIPFQRPVPLLPPLRLFITLKRI
jgi:hypothetical protein